MHVLLVEIHHRNKMVFLNKISKQKFTGNSAKTVTEYIPGLYINRLSHPDYLPCP